MTQLVLDTGPFLEFLVWKIELEEAPVGIPFRRHVQLHGLDSELRARAFDRLLRRHRGRLLTTLGVLAEIHQHARSCLASVAKAAQPLALERLWAFVVGQLHALELGEPPAPVRSIPPEALGRFGVVDCSLADLAYRMSSRQQPAIVVTNDRQLFAHCYQRGIAVQFARDLADEQLA